MGNSFPALIFSVGGQEMVELVMAVRERKRRSLPRRMVAISGEIKVNRALLGRRGAFWE